MSKNESNDISIYGHLDELRKSLLFSIFALLIATPLVYIFQLDNLLGLITAPIEKLGLEPVIIGVTEGFFVRIKTAIFGGIIVSLPVIIWQILRFVFPALYSHEKRAVLLLVFSGVVLFIGGVIFSYVFILDLALKVMLVDFSGGLSPLVSFDKYLSFVILMLIPFGLVFEIPIIALVLTRIGLITPSVMSKHRKLVIMAVLILAALLTPPDLISQVFLAIPMLILYELSILLAKIAVPKKKADV